MKPGEFNEENVYYKFTKFYSGYKTFLVIENNFQENGGNKVIFMF